MWFMGGIMATAGLELKLLFSAAGLGAVAGGFGSVSERLDRMGRTAARLTERMNAVGTASVESFVKQKRSVERSTAALDAHQQATARTAKALADAESKHQAAIDAAIKYRTELGRARRTDAQRAELARLTEEAEKSRAAADRLGATFDKQRKSAKQMADDLQAGRLKLQALRDEMRKAGVNTSSLGQERGRLRRVLEKEQVTLDALTRRYQRLQAVQADMAKHKEALSARKADVVAAAGIGASLAVPMVVASKFEDKVKQISITGELYKERGAEAGLAGSIRRAAVGNGVSHDNVAGGVAKLVEQGMNANEAGSYSGMLAKTAKATRAEMTDLAELTYTLQTKFKLKTEGEIFEAINALAKAGKLGSYEIKAMARAFPELGGAAASFGSVGLTGVKDIGAIMQTMRAGAGSAAEAEVYMRNWFSHMSANSTQEHFSKVGIDFEKAKLAKVSAGKGEVSNIEASFMVFDDYIKKVVDSGQVRVYDKKGKLKSSVDMKAELAAAFEQAKKDKLSGDALTQYVQSAVQRVGLSSVLQDMQATQAYLAWMSGKDKYYQTRAALDAPDVGKTIDNDAAQQATLATEKWNALKTTLADLGITVGNVLAPTLGTVLDGLNGVTSAANSWAQEWPSVTQGLVLTVGTVAAFTAGLLVLRTALTLGRLAIAGSRAVPLVGALLGNPAAAAAATASGAATLAAGSAATGAGAAAGVVAAAAKTGMLARAGGLLGKLAPVAGTVGKLTVAGAVGTALLGAGSAMASDGSPQDKAGAVAGAAGGLAGGLAGAKFGALIGSAVLPGVGSLVGMALGGLIGSAAGEWGAAKAGRALAGPRKPEGQNTPGKASANLTQSGAAAALPPKPAPQQPIEVKVEYKPQVTIHGDPTPQSLQKFADMLRQQQATIEAMLKRALAEQTRRAY